MKAFVKKDTCIGCGACTVIANNIFEIGDDGLAEAIAPYVVDNEKEITEDKKIKEIPEEEFENVIDAAESCPVGAIEVVEENA